MKKMYWLVSLVLFLFSFTLVTTASGAEKNYGQGHKVKVLLSGRYRVCTVVECGDNKVKVHFEDDETLYDRWVPLANVENFTYHRGEIILVNKDGKWLPAKVLAGGTLKYKVNYIGLESQQDEWVGPERIREVKYKAGDAVMVYWNSDWYQAKIMAYENGKYKVHYEGFPDSYDEWVTVERIKK